MLRKKLSSIIAVALCMAFGLSACGNSETPAASSDSTQAVSEDASADAGDTTASDADGGEDLEDMAEIEMYYYAFIAPKDVQHVEDAVNAITEDAINVHVNINVLDVNSFIQQMSIMMAGSERIDLMMTGFASASYSNMMAQNQLMDIAPYIEEYGPNITETLGDMLDATTIGDAIYGVPAYRNVVSSAYIFMRQDVLDDLGLTEKARNMTSFDEFVEILEAVHSSEKWSYLYPYLYQQGSGPLQTNANVSGNFADADVFDTLGDTLGIVHADENGQVTLNMSTESYQAAAAMVREWEADGYSYFDLSGSGGSCEDYIKNDALFSFISSAEFGAETAKSAAAGTPMVAVKLYNSTISSEACTKFAFCVPSTAKEPAAAVKFLNLAITSPEINNLLAWGVEGVDYEVVDGVAQYIEGNEEPDYHLFDYSVPNQFLCYPWDGDPADFREQSEADLKASEVSPYLGFSCDLSDFVNESAAVSSVIEEYRDQIGSGQGSEAVLQEYIDKLNSVNVQALIDEYQRQLDEWIAAQE
ncbi:putative aldouronate transport system substrate-binding protein [Catenibacillus scindens]|uniref:Putative aldouronate transport system substrate-binding protein n=1 Tax=Catenibacillus scindens TaxID=673271 RepID=A0A7W8M3S7_9FIRM|nr:extracellular solute-binding protein [Catenibacillus scindens]MBB5263350.1 putative aldouronate transport system substrate-binding protein [Catenibacillus scindens]